MALGTLALASGVGGSPTEPVYHDSITLVGDSSYPTGGSTGLPAALKAVVKDDRTIVAVLPIDGFGYIPAWDSANSKLKFYQGDNDNGADAPGIEVANTTNLSGVTFKLLVISK